MILSPGKSPLLKPRALVWEGRGPETEMGRLGSDVLENLELTLSPEFLSLKMVPFPLCYWGADSPRPEIMQRQTPPKMILTFFKVFLYLLQRF